MQKLNLRLATLFNCIDNGYDEIWDCCCDHGYLGMHILQAKLCTTVYFVDQVSSITDALGKKLRAYGAVNYQLITDSAANLKPDSTKKHLIILAGISGNTVIDIMQGLQALNPHTRMDYLLSPNYQLAEVREYLVKQHWGLLDEKLVFENEQTYEVIYVTGENTGEIKQQLTLTGNMWDMHNPQHRKYLDKLIFNHTHKIVNDPDKTRQAMLELYQEIKERHIAK